MPRANGAFATAAVTALAKAAHFALKAVPRHRAP